MNVRYDDTVHALNDEYLPLCGSADIPAEMPEKTTAPITCIWCESLL